MARSALARFVAKKAVKRATGHAARVRQTVQADAQRYRGNVREAIMNSRTMTRREKEMALRQYATKTAKKGKDTAMNKYVQLQQTRQEVLLRAKRYNGDIKRAIQEHRGLTSQQKKELLREMRREARVKTQAQKQAAKEFMNNEVYKGKRAMQYWKDFLKLTPEEQWKELKRLKTVMANPAYRYEPGTAARVQGELRVRHGDEAATIFEAASETTFLGEWMDIYDVLKKDPKDITLDDAKQVRASVGQMFTKMLDIPTWGAATEAQNRFGVKPFEYYENWASLGSKAKKYSEKPWMWYYDQYKSYDDEGKAAWETYKSALGKSAVEGHQMFGQQQIGNQPTRVESGYQTEPYRPLLVDDGSSFFNSLSF